MLSGGARHNREIRGENDIIARCLQFAAQYDSRFRTVSRFENYRARTRRFFPWLCNKKGICAHEYTLDNIGRANRVEPHNHDPQRREADTHALLEREQPGMPFSIGPDLATQPFLHVLHPEVKADAEQWADKPWNGRAEGFGAGSTWKDTGRDRGELEQVLRPLFFWLFIQRLWLYSRKPRSSCKPASARALSPTACRANPVVARPRPHRPAGERTSTRSR
jgi:hypothetical protein